MDWSPDAVLDFDAKPHCRYASGSVRLLLWPVWKWQVVAPEVRPRKLNPLQRVVLQLHIAGVREHAEIGALLDVETQLAVYIAQELHGMGLLKGSQPSERAQRVLDDTELQLGALRTGWVFQDAVRGVLLPRFLGELQYAEAEADEKGRPKIVTGTKGRPSAREAFVVRGDQHPAVTPSPREILEAARRHRRHIIRRQRARLNVGVKTPEDVQQVSFISERPERAHVLTKVYVPENEHADQPWYVADPFGFGASQDLRAALKQVHDQSTGSFRQLLDRITGEAKAKRHESWLQMQTLLREGARGRVSHGLPLTAAPDQAIRSALEEVFIELARLEQSAPQIHTKARSRDTLYLRLRQAIEEMLKLLQHCHPPRTAWQRVDKLPSNASRRVILECGRQVGFATVPDPVQGAKPSQIWWICNREADGRIRPTLAALVLAASRDQAHPFHRLATEDDAWLEKVNHLAAAAGSQVHSDNRSVRQMAEVQNDIDLCVYVIRSLLNHL
jgi:hypothetical protein